MADHSMPSDLAAAGRRGRRGRGDGVSLRDRSPRERQRRWHAHQLPPPSRDRRTGRRLPRPSRAAVVGSSIEVARLPSWRRLGNRYRHRQEDRGLGLKVRPGAALSPLRAHRATPAGAPLQAADEKMETGQVDTPHPFGCHHLAECRTGPAGRVPAADLQALLQAEAGLPVDQG